MSTLDNSILVSITGSRVELPGHFDGQVVIESARILGSGLEVRVRLANGQLDEAVLSAADVAELVQRRPREPEMQQPANADKLRLIVESARVRLAYTYDRQFAVSLSGIRTLPHQIEAVYLKMLPQPRLRFLLADDSGAGKTIIQPDGGEGLAKRKGVIAR